MSALDELRKSDLFENYDAEVFFEALNESLEKWRDNELYSRKLENSDFEGRVESWGDVKKLPTIGMKEFKNHPEDLAIDELDEEKALYSSGTTSGNKSFAPRTEETLEIHRENLERFAKQVIGEADYSAALSVSEKDLEKLPTDLSRRALFRYILWLMDQFDTSYFVEVDEEQNIEPDHEGLLRYLQENDGKGVIKASTSGMAEFCEFLEQRDEEVDLGEDGIIITGGGWKGDSGKTREELRTQIADLFNIREENQLDFYSATEFTFFTGPKPGDEDPDAKRVPSQAYTYIADLEKFRQKGVVEPVEEGDEGLLVVVDPLNHSYPGVILTDDVMKKTGSEYGEDTRIKHMGRSTKI